MTSHYHSRFVSLGNPPAVQKCGVDFWDFALPVAFGSTAGLAASWAARRLLDGDHESTKDTVAAVTHAAAFWLFGGLTWVLRQRHAHHNK